MLISRISNIYNIYKFELNPLDNKKNISLNVLFRIFQDTTLGWGGGEGGVGGLHNNVDQTRHEHCSLTRV
jgi:hypothetical protein